MQSEIKATGEHGFSGFFMVERTNKDSIGKPI